MNHAQILDSLIREIDALQSSPFRPIVRAIRPRVRVRWISKFISLLVRP